MTVNEADKECHAKPAPQLVEKIDAIKIEPYAQMANQLYGVIGAIHAAQLGSPENDDYLEGALWLADNMAHDLQEGLYTLICS